ncbi:class I heat shock protein-like [Camellia sinensis]|uniref:class I heat shock protein-like n=1 Tax=Camellia sinensis TaxID=4442 RepID=UPI001035AAFC|nr:class I heat shock protein-like [Camellia sinensis]
MKEKEAATIGCGIGLCAIVSPGWVRKDEVKVQVEDGNILQMSGERSKEMDSDDDIWHRVERRLGNFLRRFRLPENFKVDEIKCGLKDGVLTVTVTVPKEEMEKKGKLIDVA